MRMQQGLETMILEQGAEVQVGDLVLKATKIELYGEQFRFVRCEGNVSLIDTERGIALSTSSLLFDRTEETLLCESWTELEDTINQVAASSARMEFFLQDGLVLLQGMARLLKHTSEGAMICRSDFMDFRRQEQMLILKGRANIIWDPDTYEANSIRVDLKTEQITMEGSIKGTIHG